MFTKILQHFHKKSKKKKQLREPAEVSVKSEDILLKRTVCRLKHGRIVAKDDDVILTTEDYRDFISIVSNFEHEDFQVTKVTYVLNKELSKRYLECKARFLHEGIPLNEHFVFHGTERSNISNILENGFRIGGVDGHPVTNGSIYGQGIYTSSVGKTPAAYAYDMCLVACFALSGEIGKHSRIPPQHPSWWIFSSADQLLPCYVVYFEKDAQYSPLLSLTQQCSYKSTVSQEDALETIDDGDKKAVEVLCADMTTDRISCETVRAIQKQLKNIMKVQMNMNVEERGWILDVESLTRLDMWRFLLTGFSDKIPLAKDLKKKDEPGITLEITFPENYPTYPPFIRVVKPRLMRFMDGGGGHVTAGGGICLQMLTTSGWDPKYTIESLLQVVHVLLSSKDPPARLAKNYQVEYTIAEARESFTRVAKAHNWI